MGYDSESGTTTPFGTPATKDAGAPIMNGAARTVSSDDGANIWFESTTRMHGTIMMSDVAEDPITAMWEESGMGASPEDGMAIGPVVTDQGLKALVATFYNDNFPRWSKLTKHNIFWTERSAVDCEPKQSITENVDGTSSGWDGVCIDCEYPDSVACHNACVAPSEAAEAECVRSGYRSCKEHCLSGMGFTDASQCGFAEKGPAELCGTGLEGLGDGTPITSADECKAARDFLSGVNVARPELFEFSNALEAVGCFHCLTCTPDEEWRFNSAAECTAVPQNVQCGGDATHNAVCNTKTRKGRGCSKTSTTILENMQDSEDPWVVDAQTYYDADEQRLWIVWGGHETYVSELHPATGNLCCTPACGLEDGLGGVCNSSSFHDHDSGVHSRVLSWDQIGYQKASSTTGKFEGDGCSGAYQEGPALYKHGTDWFVFSSYGSMGEDYTIRVCRATDPRGPYVDKSGRSCLVYEQGVPPGSSMLLGPEDEQSVPGHPHLWQEGGRHFMGYDYRRNVGLHANGDEGTDYMAIREIFWITNAAGAPGTWPTIWQPMQVVVDSNDFPDLVGKTLGIKLENIGGMFSTCAFDSVVVKADPVTTTTQQTTTPTTTPTTTLMTRAQMRTEYSDESEANSQSALSSGAIAGAVIGGILGALTLMVAAYLIIPKCTVGKGSGKVAVGDGGDGEGNEEGDGAGAEDDDEVANARALARFNKSKADRLAKEAAKAATQQKPARRQTGTALSPLTQSMMGRGRSFPTSPVVEDRQMQSRGNCVICGQPVLISQPRDKNSKGLYFHTRPKDCVVPEEAKPAEPNDPEPATAEAKPFAEVAVDEQDF